VLRVLLVADTHLGFDLPQKPRVARTRRGPDFFANLELALAPAHRGEVDLVVHGGDLLFRSRVGSGLAAAALEPLLAVADRGVPVVLVPGNHERSSLPYPLLAAHEHFHVFDRPRTVALEVRGMKVVVAGFPCERSGVAGTLAACLAAAAAGSGDVRLLCAHQTFEGATVGPVGYVFRPGPDVVSGRAIPPGFAAVLAGHIHRHQTLTHDLAGRPLAAPVLYPGSIERTGFAERDERKGYLTLAVAPDRGCGGRLAGWEFHELPARPMHVVTVPAGGLGDDELRTAIAALLAPLPANAVVQLRISGVPAPGGEAALRAASLRGLYPETMIVELAGGWPSALPAPRDPPAPRLRRLSSG
jgi:DNA repair exonuclease SbcCD nuclease subunit